MLKRLRRLALCLVLLGAVALAYAWWIEPRWLQVKEHYLTQSALEQDVTLVCFGDTHVGLDTTAEDLARWVEQINRQQPDVVVFLGDLFDDYSQYQGDPEEVVQALADIRAADKLAVVGNHDVGGGAERVYEGLMERAGFTVLRNESAECQGIRFIGADEMLFYHPDVTGLSGQGICNILLCHEPDFADEAEPFALMLAGHTHGGQVRLPAGGRRVHRRLLPDGKGDPLCEPGAGHDIAAPALRRPAGADGFSSAGRPGSRMTQGRRPLRKLG